MKTNTNLLHQDMKQNFVLERLAKLGVNQSETGKSIHAMDYDELKMELVLAEMRKVDIEHPAHRWFR